MKELSVVAIEGYVTLRCISNTLKSNLMGCEPAIIGAGCHGDSLPIEYAVSDGSMFALGMNGKTLDLTHRLPIRMLAPRDCAGARREGVGSRLFPLGVKGPGIRRLSL